VGVTVDHAGYQDPRPDGRVEFSDYGFDLGYSVTIMPTLSLGFHGSARLVEVDGVSRAGGWSPWGSFYFPAPGISYGLRLHGPGTGLHYWVDPENGEHVEDQQKVPNALELAVEMKFPARAFEPTFVLALATERVLAYKQTFYKGGMEVTPWHFIAFRIGYADYEGIHSFRMGAALKLGEFGWNTPSLRGRSNNGVTQCLLVIHGGAVEKVPSQGNQYDCRYAGTLPRVAPRTRDDLEQRDAGNLQDITPCCGDKS